MERYRYSDEKREALESLKQPFAVFQMINGKVVSLVISDGFCRLYGHSDRKQAMYYMDHDMYRDIHPDDKERVTDAAVRFAEGDDDSELDVVYRTRGGIASGYRVIHLRANHMRTETGIRIGQAWYTDEGTYQEGEEGTRLSRSLSNALHENSILKAAHYDELTGLPNLAYFFTMCEIGKARIFSERKQGALLYIDLDGMKYYNQKYGFAEGDKLLKALSAELLRIFGKENCCHIGADRFAVSVKEDEAEEKLSQLFEAAGRINGGNSLPVRVGIYCTSIEDVPVSSAYDRAKLACDAIHKSDASSFNYYSRELSEAAKRRQYIVANLDRAMKEKWIKDYYQGIVRAADGKVSDKEALARWMDPAEGFLSPAEFIPDLEDAGLIYKMDLYMLDQVLAKIQKQKKAGLELIPHSINLSRSDFEACDIVEEIRKRVDAAGVPHDLMIIEITESIIGSDFEFMKEQISRFRQLGFPVWMDDFGSGYSSLDVLQSIQFDLIKFDMGFMRKLDQGERGKIILTELMKMAALLGVDTICEGVETEEQVHFLQEIGCTKLQGFFFSNPAPEEN